MFATTREVQISQLEKLRANRGWYFVIGLAMVILGLAAIGTPLVATLAISTLVGWILVIGGVIHAVHAFRSHDGSGMLFNLLVSALFVILGGWMLVNPVEGALTLTLILAGFFIAEGVLKTAAGVQLRPTQGWVWMFFSGVGSLLVGIVIWSGWPGTSLWVIGLLLGIDLLIGGWSTIMLALAAGKLKDSPV